MHISSALLLANESSNAELLINYKPHDYYNKSTNAIKTNCPLNSLKESILLSLDFYVGNKRLNLENFLFNIFPQLEETEIFVNNKKSFLIY